MYIEQCLVELYTMMNLLHVVMDMSVLSFSRPSTHVVSPTLHKPVSYSSLTVISNSTRLHLQ